MDINHSVVKNYCHRLRCPDRLFIYKKDSIPNLHDDLIVTGGHSMLVDTISVNEYNTICHFWKRVYGTSDKKIRMPACLDTRSEPYEMAGEFDVYHIVLEHSTDDQDYGVYANGMLSESCSAYAMRKMREYNESKEECVNNTNATNNTNTNVNVNSKLISV